MKKVLVVDDSSTNNLLCKSILEDAGFEVCTAETSDRAFKLLADSQLDLILLDLMMPEVDGFIILKQLKATNKTKDIPVIIVTAKDDSRTRHRTMEMGAIDLIVKPIMAENLLDKVLKAL